MQSPSTLPDDVCARIARCPMPNAGVVSMVVIPLASRRNLLLYAFRSPSRVVQDWPDVGTNCRSSVQARHALGEASEGGYCVPHAEQMNAGMNFLAWSHSVTRPALANDLSRIPRRIL